VLETRWANRIYMASSKTVTSKRRENTIRGFDFLIQ